MKKYMLKRILFSLFSLFVVVMVVMLLIYSLIDRRVIFQTDDVWNKRSGNDRVVYEYAQYEKFSYLTYFNFNDYVSAEFKNTLGDTYSSDQGYKDAIAAVQKEENALYSRYGVDERGNLLPEEERKKVSPDDIVDPVVKKFIEEYESKGFVVKYLRVQRYSNGRKVNGSRPYLFAVKENNPLMRLFDYIGKFLHFETTGDVKDPGLKDRYVRFESDPYGGGFALVGSGTQHKYLLYFDGRFPFIHQNWVSINLGTSFTRYRGSEITTVINTPTGGMASRPQQFPAMLGTDQYTDTAIDFHTVTYNENWMNDTEDIKSKFTDHYTTYAYHREGLSQLENSFVIGLAATLIAYLLGLPIGMLMARRKDKLADKLGNIYIIFVMAVPSLAYIFMFKALGTSLFNLPDKFANAEVPILAYILPTISLALPSIGSLMKWMRRYMIDQMNSDYVKFARAEGLSEREIYNVHISKNAFIFLVHGIPASILGCLTGAIITERVYSVPGVGNLLTEAINQHDNGIIVACTVFYTSLSILSVILGDLLLAKYDPRISLSSSKGGGR